MATTATTATTQTARQEPRQKVSRSTTAQTGTLPNGPNRPRRTVSEDSSSPDARGVARTANTRTKSHGASTAAPSNTKTKEKPSAHTDFIDQLDYSGAGVGMFHHDGPFDACAPSRNKTNKTHRAPIYAFDAYGAPINGSHNVPVVDKRLSPLAQATIAAMAQSDSGPYPTASYEPQERRNSPNSTMLGARLGATSRKMTLTEAWGTNEPQPFEEFSAGTGFMGRNSARSSLEQLPPEGGYDAHQRRDPRTPSSRRGESLDIPRRNKIPPPQPIVLPGQRAPGPDDQAPSSPLSDSPRPVTVTRTKSLMQRIRRMRDNPNVPVGGTLANSDVGYHSDIPHTSTGGAGWAPGTRTVKEEREPSESNNISEKPRLRPPHQRTHARGNSKEKQRLAPQTVPESPDEPFVIVNANNSVAASREKALPAPPSSTPQDDGTGHTDRTSGATQNGSSITRKTSLYKKVKGAVVGGQKR